MKQLSKVAILEKIVREHDRLLQTLSLLSDIDWLTTGVLPLPEPGQSCKDVLAHLTAWEQRMILSIEATLTGAPQPIYPTTPRFNEQIFDANKDRSFADIQTDFERSYIASHALVQQLSEEELTRDGIWQSVGYNTYGHYKWARTVVRRWQRAKVRIKDTRQWLE
ncbi:MAG: ClbS/DfsB family four-helix bundle protein [Caldilineaceae bacterium]